MSLTLDPKKLIGEPEDEMVALKHELEAIAQVVVGGGGGSGGEGGQVGRRGRVRGVDGDAGS